MLFRFAPERERERERERVGVYMIQILHSGSALAFRYQIFQIHLLHVLHFFNVRASHATSICIAYASREETGEPVHPLVSTGSSMLVHNLLWKS